MSDKLTKWLKKKRNKHHDLAAKIGMDDVSFNFVLGQKTGIDEVLYFIEHGKEMFPESEDDND